MRPIASWLTCSNLWEVSEIWRSLVRQTQQGHGRARPGHPRLDRAGAAPCGAHAAFIQPVSISTSKVPFDITTPRISSTSARHRLMRGDGSKGFHRAPRQLIRNRGFLGEKPRQIGRGAQGPFAVDPQEVDASRAVFHLQVAQRSPVADPSQSTKRVWAPRSLPDPSRPPRRRRDCSGEHRSGPRHSSRPGSRPWK